MKTKLYIRIANYEKACSIIAHVKSFGDDAIIVEGGLKIEATVSTWHSVNEFIEQNNINCDIDTQNPRQTNLELGRKYGK